MSDRTSTELVLRTEPCGRLTPGIIIPDDCKIDNHLLVIPPFYQPLVDRILLSHGLIVDRIDKLALDIHDYFKGSKEDVVLVCVLKSAALFYRQLTASLRNISKWHGVGADRETYKEFYMKASSYLGERRNDQVVLDQSLDSKANYKTMFNGNHVVLVDDILDSGCTLSALLDDLKKTGAKSVTSAILFSKRAPWNGIVPDWVGFDLPNEFVVGYGTDCDEHYRDLEHLGVASEFAKKKFGF